jgi:hypothetical protein
MQMIRIRQWFRAAPENLFEHFGRHEALGELWPGRFVRVRAGEDEADGLGSVREVRLPGWRFREQIIDFRRPELIGYRIVSPVPLVTHHYGEMRFRPEGQGTLLDYRIALDARGPMTPVITRMLEQALKPGIRRLAARYE